MTLTKPDSEPGAGCGAEALQVPVSKEAIVMQSGEYARPGVREDMGEAQ